MVAPSQLGAPFRLRGLTKVSPYGMWGKRG